jgi:hypothetical protein
LKLEKIWKIWLMWTVLEVRFKPTERTVSSKVETTTFYLTWTDLNKNLKIVTCYLMLQSIGTSASSFFFFARIIERLEGYILFLLTKFLIVNVYKMSGTWSYDVICTFFKCTKC